MLIVGGIERRMDQDILAVLASWSAGAGMQLVTPRMSALDFVVVLVVAAVAAGNVVVYLV